MPKKVVETARLLTVGEVAKILNVSDRHVWRLDDKGLMPPAIKLLGSVRWDRVAISNWIEAGCPPCKKEST